MTKSVLLAAAASCVLSSLASAQPQVNYDMGTLTAGEVVQSAGIGSNGIGWFMFTIPEASRCQMRYFDIVVESFAGFDTEIGLYDHSGKRITNDDDDGVGRASALSFGATSPLRPLTADGRPGDGRDGPLPAGTYYLALGEFNTNFDDSDWSVSSSTEGFGGSCNVHFIIGTGDPVADPSFQSWESLCAVDAGDLPATAAIPSGNGGLTTIYGFGKNRADIDMYRICINDPNNFEADTFPTTQMDTQLYLFDATGHGVTLNDDAPESVQSQITSAVVASRGGGTYYLAVAPSSSTPVDAEGQPLWDSSGFGERPADGPGGANPIGGWISNAFNDNSQYIISLQGVLYCPPQSTCGTADFNCDGDVGTDSDISGFFACLSGSCPSAPCANSADFNGDGDVGTDGDIEAFFRVLGGGTC